MSQIAAQIGAENAAELGAAGSNFYADTDAHTGRWYCLRFVNDTVFTSLTASGLSGTLGATVFPAGFELFGVGTITAFTLASGAVQALKLT